MNHGTYQMSRVLSEDYDTISGSEQGRDKNSWLGEKVVDKSLLINSLITQTLCTEYRPLSLFDSMRYPITYDGKLMAIILY